MQVGSTLAPGLGCDQKVSVTPRGSGSGCELWKFIFLGDDHHFVVSVRKMLLPWDISWPGLFSRHPQGPCSGNKAKEVWKWRKEVVLWSYTDLGSNPSSPRFSSVTLGKVLNCLGSCLSQPWEGVNNKHPLPGVWGKTHAQGRGSIPAPGLGPSPHTGELLQVCFVHRRGPGLKATW